MLFASPREEQQLRELRTLKALLKSMRRRRQRGGDAATKEEEKRVTGAVGQTAERRKKKSLQLNQKCSGKARCYCEACGPLRGDHTGYVHCFHCQCESYPAMECELDESNRKGGQTGWFW